MNHRCPGVQAGGCRSGVG
ncbi:MAG: hypothetical protein ACOYLN_08735 [Blastocatellia bacterium]